MLKGSALEWNMAKPSWCLEVMTMYFIPADLGEGDPCRSASKFTGLNCVAEPCSPATGIVALFMIHSPMPGDPLAVLGARRDGVKAPVDEHAEARLSPPGHACVALRGGFGILNRGDGMSGRHGDTLTLYLGERG